MASAQVGKTELLGNIVGFHIDQDPAPILVVMPTLEIGESWSKDRLSPMVRDTVSLATKISAQAREAGNTLLHKTFAGGHITIAGANSAASLASRPIRIVLCDEVDRFPPSAGAEGDPVSLAFKRTTTFWNRKRLLISTPTVKGVSRIEKAWDQSDQRRYFVPCPECSEMQVLRWAQVRWPEGKPEDAQYACESCGSLWDDATRWSAVSRGEWRATSEWNGVAGFHVWEAYSSWVRLADTAKAFVAAQGHDERLRVWVNTSLGETWQERGDAPDWQRLYDRRELYRRGTVPAGGLLLTAGVDVQRDRLECSVWAWGRGLESWLVDHIIIEGGPGSAVAWDELTALLDEAWPCKPVGDLRLVRIAVDAGFDPAAVHAWVRSVGPQHAMAVKGVEGFARTSLVSGPTFVDATEGGRKIKRGSRLWSVSTAGIKSETYRLLRLDPPTDEDLVAGGKYPAGYVHLPRDVEAEWCKQLVSEQLLSSKNRRGFQKLEWQQLRTRNEALDCRVYARAAAEVIGLPRYTERQWHRLDRVDDVPVVNVPAPSPTDLPAENKRAQRDAWFDDTRDWF